MNGRQRGRAKKNRCQENGIPAFVLVWPLSDAAVRGTMPTRYPLSLTAGAPMTLFAVQGHLTTAMAARRWLRLAMPPCGQANQASLVKGRRRGDKKPIPGCFFLAHALGRLQCSEMTKDLNAPHDQGHSGSRPDRQASPVWAVKGVAWSAPSLSLGTCLSARLLSDSWGSPPRLHRASQTTPSRTIRSSSLGPASGSRR
jgi:hypothetical protein